MNCEGCPVMHGQGCPKASPITEDSSKVRCPVTPANMTIVKAILAGEWRCDTCGVGVCDARRCGTPCGEWEQETDQQQWLKAESAWTEATTCPTCQGAGKLFRWRLEQAYPVKSEPWDCYACGGTGKRQPRKKVGSDES